MQIYRLEVGTFYYVAVRKEEESLSWFLKYINYRK